MKIAIAGATGLVGRHLVEILCGEGIEIAAISRGQGVDLTTGAGLEAALSGVWRIIDVTNAGTVDEGVATAFFTSAAHHLQREGERAGVDRLVVLSIVGIDRLTSGYYAAKRRHEQAARSGRVPAVVLRSTQFHEFAGQVLTWGRRGAVCRVQEMLVQPLAVAAVARALVDLALSDEAPPMSEVAGPHVEDLVDMAARLAARRNDPVQVQGFREEGPDGEALAGGALLPGPHATLLGPTFQEWLDAEEHTLVKTR